MSPAGREAANGHDVHEEQSFNWRLFLTIGWITRWWVMLIFLSGITFAYLYADIPRLFINRRLMFNSKTGPKKTPSTWAYWYRRRMEKNQAEVKVLDKKTNIYGNPKYYQTPDNVRDMVAGFLYLRVIDFNKHKKGDTLSVSGFFEDTAYNMKIIYAGKDKVNTKLGKIPCHKLVPVMPDNKLFDGENSVTCWISDDGNRIPGKIQAKMFIGSTGIELTGIKGLRNQLRVLQ